MITQHVDYFKSFLPQADIPVPDNPTVREDWHHGITNELRQHLIVTIITAIFPSLDPAAIKDQRIKDLFSYAKKVEKEMFEHANTKEKYYQLLAEKIYKIQKELQEMKNKRLTGQTRNTDKKKYYQLPAEKIYEIQKELEEEEKKIEKRQTERNQIAEIAAYLSDERENSFEHFNSAYAFLHDSQCKDVNCREASNCLVMQKVVEHTKICMHQNSACHVCKQLIEEVGNYHSKQCITSYYKLLGNTPLVLIL